MKFYKLIGKEKWAEEWQFECHRMYFRSSFFPRCILASVGWPVGLLSSVLCTFDCGWLHTTSFCRSLVREVSQAGAESCGYIFVSSGQVVLDAVWNRRVILCCVKVETFICSHNITYNSEW